MHRFYENLWRIRSVFRADRGVGPYNAFPVNHLVGADASVRPQDASIFSKSFGEFATAQRADVGIGPYWEAACFMRYRATKPTFL